MRIIRLTWLPRITMDRVDPPRARNIFGHNYVPICSLDKTTCPRTVVQIKNAGPTNDCACTPCQNSSVDDQINRAFGGSGDCRISYIIWGDYSQIRAVILTSFHRCMVGYICDHLWGGMTIPKTTIGTAVRANVVTQRFWSGLKRTNRGRDRASRAR